MGLDQYARFLTEEEEVDRRNDPDNQEYVEEDFYWRKHRLLQAWMENLYRSKGGEGEFNCVDVELDIFDINALERDIEEADLPDEHGFFWGNEDPSEYHSENSYYEKDKQFVEAAKSALAEGKRVIYSSWW